MSRKPFLFYWDSLWQFLDDALGVICLFALLYFGLFAAMVFG